MLAFPHGQKNSAPSPRVSWGWGMAPCSGFGDIYEAQVTPYSQEHWGPCLHTMPQIQLSSLVMAIFFFGIELMSYRIDTAEVGVAPTSLQDQAWVSIHPSADSHRSDLVPSSAESHLTPTPRARLCGMCWSEMPGENTIFTLLGLVLTHPSMSRPGHMQ